MTWVFLLPVLAVLLVLNLASISGWSRIASHYETMSFPKVGCRRGVTGRLGMVLYRNLVAAATEHGLYLRTARWTTFFHRSLFISVERDIGGRGPQCVRTYREADVPTRARVPHGLWPADIRALLSSSGKIDRLDAHIAREK